MVNRKGGTIRNDIQGLRAIAVLAVILFHIDMNWLAGGFLGVDIFFVISGFLVTSIILRARSVDKFSIISFYRNRIRRIAPAYYAMLAIVSSLAAVLFIPRDFDFYQDSFYSALYFASNQFFARFGDYFAPNSYELPLLHTWSLSIEMQFYCLLPIMLLAFPSRYSRLLVPIVLILTVCTSSYASYFTYRQESYFELTTRAPQFLIGSSLALFNVGENLSLRLSGMLAWIGFSMVAASFAFVDKNTTFAGMAALLPCVGTALIIATPHSKISRLLSTPFLARIGDLSYSLYLWHWPLLALFRYCNQRYKLSTLELVIFALLVTGISWLSYRHIEMPFRRSSSPRSYVQRFAFGALPIVALSLTAVDLNRSLVPLPPISLTRYAPSNEICHGQIIGDCLRGAYDGKLVLLVFGDSHAAQLNYFFDIVGTQNSLRARVITSSSCVNIPGFDVHRLRDYARKACESQIEFAARYVGAADMILIAGLWEYHIQSPAFIESIDRFLSNADLHNRSVLIMAQIPGLTGNVMRANRLNQLGLPVNVTKRNGWQTANEKLADIVARHPSARFLNFSEIDLFANTPFYNDELIYFDDNHLNEVGAHRYGEAVAPYFSKMVN